VTYTFTVQSRNSIGYSTDSATLSVIAATYPDAPIDVIRDSATTTETEIGINWSEGLYDGGSPILDYKLYTD